MSVHELLKVNNQKEHLATLKVELSIANKKLADTLKEHNALKETLRTTTAQLAAAHKELALVNSRHSYLTGECSKKEEAMNRLDSDLAAKKEDHARSLKVLAAQENTIRERISQGDADTASFSIKLTELQNSIEQKGGLIASLVERISELDTILDEKHKHLARAVAEGAKREEEIARRVDAKQKELADVEAKIQEEKEKVALPLANVLAREEAVARRENNLTILKTRFEQRFKKVYPDKKVNI